MERRISMIRRAALNLLALLACVLADSASAERSVVLVTSESCPMQTMGMLDIRKAFLGIVVSYEGHSIQAFRQNNDDMLSRIFYQSVVAMSEKSYERRLLSMLLKYGTPRPREFDDVHALADALRLTYCGIAYMWAEDAESSTGVKSIRLLWQGD
jgi:hypothetical protein